MLIWAIRIGGRMPALWSRHPPASHNPYSLRLERGAALPIQFVQFQPYRFR